MDHPDIIQAERTGYANMIAQPEHNGIDFYGNEILTDDTVFVDEDGEMVLEDNIERYLTEVKGFKITQAS